LRSIFFSHIPAIWKLSAVLLLTLTVLHLLLLTLTVLHLPPSLSSLPVILPLPLSSPAARTTADLRRITTITSLQHLTLQLSPSYFSSHRSLSSTRPPPSVASYHYNKLITTIATCGKCSLKPSFTISVSNILSHHSAAPPTLQRIANFNLSNLPKPSDRLTIPKPSFTIYDFRLSPTPSVSPSSLPIQKR
jgi:hypothetical protein